MEAQETLTPKRKAVTIQDVARRAGTAKSTASLALNGKGWVSPETREIVLRAARELNFEVDPLAKRLSVGRDFGTVALLSHHLDVGVGSLKVQAIQRLLTDAGYNAPIQGYGFSTLNGAGSQVKLLRALRQQRPQAIICNTGLRDLHDGAAEELEQYRQEGGSLLCYDWPVPLGGDCVLFDREDNTYQSAKYLIELGHRRIGLFDAAACRPGSPRSVGFTRALSEGGLSVRPDWIFAHGDYSDCEGGGQFLARQFRRMPREDRPTAMCIVNDLTAMVFVTTLRESGLSVPGDVSVVGHDDLMMARYGAVPLTTVSHPVEAIAQAVVDTLLSRLTGDPASPPKHTTVKGRLVVRQSAAPPRH